MFGVEADIGRRLIVQRYRDYSSDSELPVVVCDEESDAQPFVSYWLLNWGGMDKVNENCAAKFKLCPSSRFCV